MLAHSPTAPPPRAPDGAVLYAIGDIHGRLDLLRAVTGEITRAAQEADATRRRTVAVFLGDYVDRGPHSAGVIDHLIDFRARGACQTVFLRGNHEQVMLDLIDGTERSTRWLSFGGVETLTSYGVGEGRRRRWQTHDTLRRTLKAAVPAGHVEFLRQTEMFARFGDYIFVHAGLRADRMLEEQSLSDMLWFRHEREEMPIWAGSVVHGHTPHARPLIGQSRIGIDTGAFLTGALTVLRLEGDRRQFLKSEISGGAAEMQVWDEVAGAAEAERHRLIAGEEPPAAAALRRWPFWGR